MPRYRTEPSNIPNTAATEIAKVKNAIVDIKDPSISPDGRQQIIKILADLLYKCTSNHLSKYKKGKKSLIRHDFLNNKLYVSKNN